MRKLVGASIIILLVASCGGKHRLMSLTASNGTNNEWPTNLTAQEVIESTIGSNIAAIGGDKYNFGTMKETAAVMSDPNTDPYEYKLRDKKKECTINLSDKLKLKYDSCAKKDGCKVTFSIAKSCGVRPLFVIKYKYTKEELATCKAVGYLKGVMALKQELAINDKELLESKNGKAIEDRKVDPETASFIGYLVYNKVSIKEVGVDPKFGARGVVSIFTDKKEEPIKVCLDDFIQKSAYSQDVADKFIMDKEVLHKTKENIPGAKGSLRINGKKSIAVFKATIEF
ncbi:MAG: hypothetical protein WCQ53_02940 [bacterium]